MDTIDITNLNRQFLFRKKDVGKSKAEVAAEFVMSRVPGCHVEPHICRIQDKDHEFYQQFKVVIAGLDNIDARRWLNSTLVQLVQYEEQPDPETGECNPIGESIIPLIDGGTEAFAGHVRIVIPKCTACFECTLNLFTPATTFQLCTIASTPRNAEHCIAYAYILQWGEHFDRKIDTDSPEDMQWIFEHAEKRAKEFGIPGVTYFKTLGVVKTIIPAVASTNAIIAANCVNEAIKILSFCAQTINNYCMYNGGEGIYSLTVAHERKTDCVVCGDQNIAHSLTIARDMKVEDLITQLSNDPDYQLKAPLLTADGGLSLYAFKPEGLRKSLECNLKKCVSEFVNEGESIYAADACLNGIVIPFTVKFQ